MKALLLSSALLAPVAAFAADTIQKLDPVVVTATRSPQAGNRLPVAMIVITREDIDRSAAVHIADLLRTVGAAQVTDLYGDGTGAVVDLRGFGESAHSNTLVLVDGRRLNNPDLASPNLNSISLKDVERIEIIQGSAGTLYGDQAVGGVINIITREPDSSAASLEAAAGSYDGRHVRGSGSFVDESRHWSLRLSGEGRESDNYRDHSALDYRNFLGRAGYSYRSGAVFLEGSRIEEDLLTPGGLNAAEAEANRRQSGANYANDFTDTDTTLYRLGWQQSFSGSWKLLSDITRRRSNGNFRTSSVFGPAAADSRQERDIVSINPRLAGEAATPWGSALITAGIDAQRASYELSSSIGPQNNVQRQRDAYAQAIVPLPARLEVTAGARLARVDNAVYDNYNFPQTFPFHDTEHSLEAGLAWKPDAASRLFLHYDRNFRFAKVEEFTYIGFPPVTNQVSLKTQHGDSYELGASRSWSKIELKGTLYRLELRDEIAYDPNTFSNLNIDRTRRNGVIVEAGWQTLDQLRLSVSGHYLDPKITGGSFTGKDIPLAAHRTGRFAADVQWTSSLSTHLEVLGTGPRAYAADYDNSLGELPGFAVVNLGLAAQWTHWGVNARLNNLLDQRYSEYGVSGLDPVSFTETAYFYPSPERNFRLGAEYRF